MSSPIRIYPLQAAGEVGVRFTLLGPVFSQDIDDLGELLEDAIKENRHGRVELDLREADAHLIKPRRLFSLWESFGERVLREQLDVQMVLQLSAEQEGIFSRPSSAAEAKVGDRGIGWTLPFGISITLVAAFLYVLFYSRLFWKEAVAYGIGVLFLESVAIVRKVISQRR